MLGYYNYSVVLTYISLIISTVGIFQAINGEMKVAIFCLMLSGLCDMFDGKIASMRERTEEEKRFGIQIDSLCDLVCFGVFPAVIGYQINQESKIYIWIAGAYVLAALIRLAFFNVKEEQRQEKQRQEMVSCRKAYQGLPVTSIALVAPIAFFMQENTTSVVYSVTLAIVALCFLLPFTIRKPRLPAMVGMMICGFAEFIVLIKGGLQ